MAWTHLPVVAYNLAGLGLLPSSLAHSGEVVAVDKAVLFNSADRHLDDAVAIFADNRLLGDDVGNVPANGIAYLFAVAQAVSRAAIAPLRGEGIVGAEYGFHYRVYRVIASSSD